MILKKSLLTVALGAALAGTAFADTTLIIKEPEVRTIITEVSAG